MIQSLLGFITNGQNMALFKEKEIDTSKFSAMEGGAKKKDQELEKKFQ